MHHAETLAADVSDPARDERGEQRARVRRRVEQADHGRRRRRASLAIAGKSALGIPKIIAFVSTRKIPSSTGVPST